MCGRFALYSPVKEIEQHYNAQRTINFKGSYNIAPGANIAVLMHDEDGHRQLTLMKWGLVPHWAEDDKKYHFINARIETAPTKASFRQAYKHRRCIIIANGFFEWKKINDKQKQPYYFTGPNQFLAMAGLWDVRRNDEAKQQTCCILTQEAMPSIQSIHHRQPVILSENKLDAWLSNDLGTAATNDTLNFYPVTSAVNKPSFNEASAIKQL